MNSRLFSKVGTGQAETPDFSLSESDLHKSLITPESEEVFGGSGNQTTGHRGGSSTRLGSSFLWGIMIMLWSPKLSGL